MSDPTIRDRRTMLARRFRLDVNVAWPDQGEDAEWVQVLGLNEFTPVISEPELEEDDAYEDEGWRSEEKTAQAWSIEATVMLRKEREEPAEAHRYLRRAAIRFGSESRAHIRWYDRDGDVDEAYMGIGIVEWARANTGVTDLDAAELTIHGRGRLHEIDNPNNGNGDNGNGGNGGNGDDNGDGEEDQD